MGNKEDSGSSSFCKDSGLMSGPGLVSRTCNAEEQGGGAWPTLECNSVTIHGHWIHLEVNRHWSVVVRGPNGEFGGGCFFEYFC